MLSPASLDLSRLPALAALSGMLLQISVESGKNAERVQEYGTRNFSEFSLVLVVSLMKFWSSGMQGWQVSTQHGNYPGNHDYRVITDTVKILYTLLFWVEMVEIQNVPEFVDLLIF